MLFRTVTFQEDVSSDLREREEGNNWQESAIKISYDDDSS